MPQDKSLQMNQTIETAILQLQQSPTPEQLAHTLTVVRRCMQAGGQLSLIHISVDALGMTFRKAEYITDFAERVHSGAFDPEGIRQKSDEDAIRELSALKGIGVWTAEMILLFCMQRPNIFSYDDLAIQRGLRMVYHLSLIHICLIWTVSR